MPIPELAAIGQVIPQRRETLGLTQEHLADVSGVGLRTIREIERRNGKKPDPPDQSCRYAWTFPSIENQGN